MTVSPFARILAASPRTVRRLPSQTRSATGLRLLVLLAGVVGAGLCWTGAVATDQPQAARSSLAVMSVALGLWASELAPMATTALLAVVLLQVTGGAKAEQAFSGFAAPVLFFLLGSAALGVAAEHTGLADRLARLLLARSNGSGRRLLLELLLSLPLQALVIPSAISRNAVLVPVYDRVLARVGRPPRLGAAVMLSLGVLGPLASSALLTGGTSPVAAAEAIGGFTWISWLKALALPYYVLIALGGVAVWLFTRPERAMVRVDEAGGRHGDLTPAEWRVVAISTGTALLWMLDSFTGWSPAVPALLALVLLMAPGAGVMTWQEFSAGAPWGICVVLAGAVSLANALTRTGAAGWLAGGLFGWIALPGGAGPMAVAVFVVTALITLAIPNRAAAITLGVPLATAYAASGALSHAAAGLIVMIAVDAETIYPAQTAANLLAYERGYFSAGRLARFNLITLGAALLVVVFVALPWWSLIGLPR